MLAESCQLQHLGPGESLQTEPLATSVAFLVSGSIRLEGDGISWLTAKAPRPAALFGLSGDPRRRARRRGGGCHLEAHQLRSDRPAALSAGRPSKR